MDIDYQKLGAKIRKIRMENQLSQEELAEKCNISTSFSGHIERGTRKMSLETLLAVAAALGTGTDQLLFDQLPPTESSLDGILRAIASKPEAQKERFFAAVRVLVKGIDEL